jgi:hypothetical protein
MPVKKKVDRTKLLKAVESGKPQAEIIKEFQFNTVTQLKTHYLDALIDAGMVHEIKTNRASEKAAIPKETFVSNLGSVAISKELIDEMGFAVDDKFTVRKTKAGISLKKL